MLRDQALPFWDLGHCLLGVCVWTACPLLLWVRPERLGVRKSCWEDWGLGSLWLGLLSDHVTQPQANLGFSKPALTLEVVGLRTVHMCVSS